MLGTDFPYQQFYPDEREGHPGRHPRRAARPARAGRRRPGRHRRATRSPRCCRCCGRRRDTRRTSTGCSSTIARRARRSTSSPSTTATGRRSTRNTSRRLVERARRRGRGVHRRRRDAGGLGGAVPADERPAPADRFVQPRHHGERAAAGDRRADRLPRPPGGRAGRRRGPGDAARRAAHAAPEPAAGQGRRVQQLAR